MRKGWNIELTSCDVGIVSITGAVVTIVFVSPPRPSHLHPGIGDRRDRVMYR